MADTMRELAKLAGDNGALADRLGSGSRFLLDLLQAPNEEVEAMYGKTDSLEQAAIELRAAVKAWEEQSDGE